MQYRDLLARIEKEFGVPGNVVLAIWARETDYGGYQLPHDAIRVLATQAYTGKRKDFFRNEFLHALKMLQDGVPRPTCVRPGAARLASRNFCRPNSTNTPSISTAMAAPIYGTRCRTRCIGGKAACR